MNERARADAGRYVQTHATIIQNLKFQAADCEGLPVAEPLPAARGFERQDNRGDCECVMGIGLSGLSGLAGETE